MAYPGVHVRLLDAPLFWRKLALLIIFSAAFIPLKAYDLEVPLQIYIGFLLVLHIYFVFILIYRVRWRALAEHRRSFLLRMLAVAFFVALLVRLQTGATFWDFVGFLLASLVVHTALLLSLTMVVGSPSTQPTASEAT